jgi:hypothetical protein
MRITCSDPTMIGDDVWYIPPSPGVVSYPSMIVGSPPAIALVVLKVRLVVIAPSLLAALFTYKWSPALREFSAVCKSVYASASLVPSFAPEAALL